MFTLSRVIHTVGDIKKCSQFKITRGSQRRGSKPAKFARWDRKVFSKRGFIVCIIWNIFSFSGHLLFDHKHHHYIQIQLQKLMCASVILMLWLQRFRALFRQKWEIELWSLLRIWWWTINNNSQISNNNVFLCNSSSSSCQHLHHEHDLVIIKKKEIV
jgi:hypothetical protein